MTTNLCWGAHAPRVLVSAPSPKRSSFSEGAEECTRGACAPPRGDVDPQSEIRIPQSNK